MLCYAIRKVKGTPHCGETAEHLNKRRYEVPHSDSCAGKTLGVRLSLQLLAPLGSRGDVNRPYGSDVALNFRHGARAKPLALAMG